MSGPDEDTDDTDDTDSAAGPDASDRDDASVVRGDAPARRPATRQDPAAMRETLDAARRRLGPAGPTEGPPQSAARQRALLREAAANQSVPLAGPPGAPSGRPAEAADADPADTDDHRD